MTLPRQRDRDRSFDPARMSDSDVRPVTNRQGRNCLTPQIALNVHIQGRRGQGGHPGLYIRKRGVRGVQLSSQSFAEKFTDSLP